MAAESPVHGAETKRRSALIASAIGATPCLMAILPWDFEGGLTPLRIVLLVNSAAVLLVELAITLFIVARGHSPVAAFGKMPLWAKGTIGLLFVIALWTAVMVATAPADAMLGLLTWVVHLLFGLSIWAMVHDGALVFSARCWAWLAAGLLAYTVMLAIFLATLAGLDHRDWSSIMPGVLQIRNLGFFFVAGYFAAMPLALGDGAARLRWLATALGAVALGMVLWTGARGALIAIGIAMAVVLTMFPVVRSRRAVRHLVLTIAGGMMLALLYQPPVGYMGVQRYFTISAAESLTDPKAGRFLIWRTTVRKIAVRPLLGYGERQFARVMAKERMAYKQPHNMGLQILLQWGVLGAVPFFALMAALSVKALRCARGQGVNSATALAIIIALLFYALYDAALYYPYPVMILTLCFALLLGRGSGGDAMPECGVDPVGQEQVG